MRALVISLLALTACLGTTGSGLVGFHAYAAGPADAQGGALTFTNGRGWTITLTRAKLHVGAVYLNRSLPVSGGQERACVLPGVYVGEVLSGLDVDTLSPQLTPFAADGTGTEDLAITGEVWLTGGRVDALEDRTIIADIAGSATRGADTLRFEGTVTIGRNRMPADADPARPGAKPLCAERIVTPISTAITPHEGGALVLRVDPRGWFANVELADLPPISLPNSTREFIDASEGQPSTNLYLGLRAASGVYRFEWQDKK